MHRSLPEFTSSRIAIDRLYSAFNDLAKVRAGGLSGVYPGHAESVYLTGRNIGDEYRYVLDRRLAAEVSRATCWSGRNCC